MKLLLHENTKAAGRKVVLDDMLLTTDMPTTAGSRMLEGYMSLLGAEAADRLTAAGYSIAGKANVGEFAIDLVGETSYFGACERADGSLTGAASELVRTADIAGAVGLDVTGTLRRDAALGGVTLVKPTYGTVSRYGTIPMACSGETVCAMAKTAAGCAQLLSAMAGHDDKDGTSLPEERCALVKRPGEAPKRVAVARGLLAGCDAETVRRFETFADFLKARGTELVEIDDSLLQAAGTAWNILLCAELCNNVSRYDGVKFGYRTKNFKNIWELYANTRTEAFGFLLKTAILYGSECLNTGKYQEVYDKSLRVRRVISERLAEIFTGCGALLLPACSRASYTMADVQADPYLSFKENRFTAPASISGLPAVVTGGVQLVGPAFSEGSLLALAEAFEKEVQ